MYAYKQQADYYELYVNSQPKPIKHKRHKNIKKKVIKKNPVIEFFRLFITLSFFISVTFFILPVAYHTLIKQVFYPDKLQTTALYENPDVKTNPAYNSKINLYSLANPTINYLHNIMFNNQFMLVPTLQKKHSEITTMYYTEEMQDLKLQLQSLMNQYKMIKPAIYVWEYDHGKYIDINANEIFPAASIIKIPVLVRMFKSIESNQFTIYDEMTMIEEYRSSGSGNLQYSQAGTVYTMDNLAKTMIQDSDNTSTNMIMSKMGGMDDVNSGLRDWGISTTYVRTWLPDLNGTNKTTAADLAKLLYNLDNPGFLNVNSREYIIDYMSHVKNNRLIQAGLGEGALFIHKTGDIGTMLGDAGIVFAPNGTKYIVVILAQRPYNSPQGKDFIVKASELIYKTIVK